MLEGHPLENDEDIVDVYAVADGEIISIEEVDDQIFARKMIGDGFAIHPSGDIVYSPIDGTVEQVAQTEHAIYISLSEDVKLLIHVGLDTIEMKGKAFEAAVEKGTRVTIGEPLIRFDKKMIEEEGYSPVITVVFLNGTDDQFDLTVHPTKDARAIETPAMQVKKI